MKIQSKSIVLVSSFFLGIIGIVVLFYPLLELRTPIEVLYERIFSKGSIDDVNTPRDIVSILIVNFFVFFVIGIAVRKLFQKISPISPFFTIPFTFPTIFILFFMFFFETGNSTFLELFFIFLGVITPLIGYIVGMIVKKNPASS
jgi:hypothetical protein